MHTGVVDIKAQALSSKVNYQILTQHGRRDWGIADLRRLWLLVRKTYNQKNLLYLGPHQSFFLFYLFCIQVDKQEKEPKINEISFRSFRLFRPKQINGVCIHCAGWKTKPGGATLLPCVPNNVYDMISKISLYNIGKRNNLYTHECYSNK